ncbi:protein kinase domain-containing protein [Dokdonella soli]
MTEPTPTARELFEEALALPAARRAAYVTAHCADPVQRATVERLLAADAAELGHQLDRSFDDLLACVSELEPEPPIPLGERIGPFTLIEKLGEGGSSVVFRAEREQAGVRQTVALKLLRHGLYSEDERRRFRDERRALAQLRHPGIARLIEGGLTDAGTPYIALELIDGVPITEHVRALHLDLRNRLMLFVDVCRAVEAAHRALIVHRDLKPSNVLVTREGEAKLLDFGIAKLLDTGLDHDATRTQHQALTPAYAAPEQFQQGQITTATDVYALGMLLGELITGQRREHGDPRTPSSRISGTDPDALPAPPKTVRRQLYGDLDNIVLKATADEPERRYASAGALADDIERHLADQPVLAHPPSRWYRARKFVARHRGGVAAAMAFLLAILAGLGIALWQARRAEIQARRAEAVQAFLSDVFRANSSSQPDPVKARQTTARALLDLGAGKIDGAMADAPEVKLSLLRLFGGLYDDLSLYDESVRLRRQAVEITRELHGTNAPEVAAALVELAGSMAGSKSANEREPVLKEAVSILDRNGDFTSATRGSLLRKLSIYYQDTDVPRALDYDLQSVRVFEALPPSADLAESLGDLGWVQHHLGKPREAIASLQRAVEVSKAQQGAKNPELPRYYAYLSDAQYDALDIAGAERNARAALEGIEAINGDEPADTAYFMMRLGKLLASTARTRDGLALLKQARDRSLASKGADDPGQTLWAQFLYGEARARSGQLREGLTDMGTAIANCRREQPDVVFLATFLESEADAQMDSGRYQQATDTLDEAAQVRTRHKQAHGTSAFNANTATRARLELARGHVDTARALLDELRIEGDDAVSWMRFEQELLSAEIALADGHSESVAKLAAEVRQQIAGNGLAAYLKACAARADLVEGMTLLRARQAGAALPLLQRAVSLRQATFDPSSPKIAEAQVALANAFLDLGDTGKARALAAAASTIDAAQEELGEHYRRPLRELLARLRE